MRNVGELIRYVLCAGTMGLLAACSSTPAPVVSPSEAPSSAADRHAVVEVARSLVGVPYRFGGASRRGMDCSGLVHYAYGEVGITVPRTVAEQRRHAFPVSLQALRPGDLLFFRLSGRTVSHVGLYIGDNRFVHAPRTGKRVSIASLEQAFWKRRLAGAGRFY